jgi:FkbM family methyltransferase
MIVYSDLNGEWTTPAGAHARYTYRSDTADWNVLSSIHAPTDEYGIPTGLSGWAFDIGGYLGAVSIALALDNPGLSVLCVEPVPDNLRLIEANIAANGVSDRVFVLQGSAGSDPVVRYGGTGNDPAEHHAFVGNTQFIVDGVPHERVTLACYSLTALMETIPTLAFLKIDCEGCEWSFLADPAIGRVERIVGEWHPPGSWAELERLLEPTHVLTAIGEHGFKAVLR